MSQLSDFQSLAQQGQELSRESLWPATVIFTGQGNPAGYSGSGGVVTEGMLPQLDGTFMPQNETSFRLRRSELVADGVQLIAQKTTLTSAGKSYRLESVVDSPGNPFLVLRVKQL